MSGLTFTLGTETYGIDVLYVQEVLRSPEIAPVPGSPSHVLGIINLRDKVIAVNDMRTMLGLPGAEGNPAIRGTCQKDDRLYILLSAPELLMDDGTL